MARVAKTWRLLPHDRAAIERLARDVGVSPIVAQLLINRNISSAAEARRFLTSPLTDLHEPELLPGINEATNILQKAVQEKRRICIYGDYDVDGVSGTAILLLTLRRLGADVDFFIPHRLQEGYGLHSETLKQLAENGTSLVVSVDCGVASLEEAEYAKKIGLELIITDHHEPNDTIPTAAAVVHPRLPTTNGDPQYPFSGLCGAGVALKLAWSLCKAISGSEKVRSDLREMLLQHVALASLGTISDVVPLLDENRVLVRHGLVQLRKMASVGIQALLKTSELDAKKELESADVGFRMGPRLNAAGRLGTARLAVELLTTKSAERAEMLANFLETQNQQRQTLERRILREAKTMAEEQNGAAALVLASESWHPGMIGIVASRLVDWCNRPVLLIGMRPGQNFGQGSGRTASGLNLHQALKDCSEHLLSHGGHAAAAGFRVANDAVDAFRERFCDVVSRTLGPEPAPAQWSIDAEVPLSALTMGLFRSIQQLEPFGAGNPQPLFMAGGLQVAGKPKRVGGGERHLSFQVRQAGKTSRAIAFGMGERIDELMSDQGRCNLVFTPILNEWQGWQSIDLQVRDFQAGPVATLV